MSLFIPNIEINKTKTFRIVIDPDGTAYKERDCGFGDITLDKLGTAIDIPSSHGRLIDADKLFDYVKEWYDFDMGFDGECLTHFLKDDDISPTVIEAEE